MSRVLVSSPARDSSDVTVVRSITPEGSLSPCYVGQKQKVWPVKPSIQWHHKHNPKPHTQCGLKLVLRAKTCKGIRLLMNSIKDKGTTV
jgi:hypothetical protein